MASISFEHVTKRYADGFEAVTDMNLAIADGEFMVLVGPSGSGKSTALRMVAGLEDITDGVLKIGADVVNDLAPKDRDVAMVFQNYALYPHMTVRRNMAFSLELAGTRRKDIDRKVDEAAEILDITRHLERKPASLSGGQRQRVAMGRAIVRDPRAFLMDEPLSNLDAKLRVQTRTAVSRLHERLGTTTIYVTHDQIEAVTLGDRIAVMRAGRIQQVGTPSDLYEHPRSLFVAGFIGSPAMNFLPGEVDGDRLRTPIGDLPVSDELRRRLDSAAGGRRRAVVVGIRPEHFEDASLVTHPARGHVFTTKIDVLEKLGSDNYAHFGVDSQRVSSSDLAELTADSDPSRVAPGAGGVQIVARLAAASAIRQGQTADLWVDTSHVRLFDPEGGGTLLADDGVPRAVPPPRHDGDGRVLPEGVAHPTPPASDRADRLLGAQARWEATSGCSDARNDEIDHDLRGRPMSNGEEHVGRFSDGGEVLGDDAPEKRHVGRFSDGGDVLGDDPEKGHVGRFSEGDEALGEDDPEKHRQGSFADEDL